MSQRDNDSFRNQQWRSAELHGSSIEARKRGRNELIVLTAHCR